MEDRHGAQGAATPVTKAQTRITHLSVIHSHFRFLQGRQSSLQGFGQQDQSRSHNFLLLIFRGPQCFSLSVRCANGDYCEESYRFYFRR